MSEPFVSIVIPAYNCELTIFRVLTAALSQDFPQNHYEVIVADDGSNDSTFDIVKSFKPVKCFQQKNAGPAAARNRGFKESKGEVVFFTDSDCIPEKDWIKTAVKHLHDPAIAVVCGSYGIANDTHILARCIHKEILFRHRRRMPEYPSSFGSYNFAVRRKVFEEAGGFNEDYPNASGEDNDLSYKILSHGYKIYFERNAIVNHFHPENISKYLKEQFRHGFWRVKMYKDHPAMARGDDYTFWKDIVEPAIVLVAAGSMGLAWGGWEWGQCVALDTLLVLLIIEFFYGFLMTKNTFETLVFGCVMFFRSFARTLGFCCGLPVFCLNFPAKKVK